MMIQKRLISVIVTTLMAIFSLLFLLPFFMMIINSFKPEEDIFNIFAKVDFTYLENYKKIFAQRDFVTSMILTIGITVCTLIFAVLFSSMAGYIVGRARKGFYKHYYWILVITMIVPFQSGMSILFNLGVTLRMINTVPYLILIYLASNVSYSSLIYFAFTKTIPHEMEESALMDGAGRWMTFWRIIFPLLLPATGTVIATEVFWYWNDMQGPLIYLGAGVGNLPKTLMMLINNFKQQAGGYSFQLYAPISALCLLSCIPMVVFFLCTQRYLLRGLVVGAVKG
jgi:raffinose/stachyose/melibiose transport system permease protein